MKLYQRSVRTKKFSLYRARVRLKNPAPHSTLQGWTKRESTIALLSLIISAIGALSTALSAISTKEQVIAAQNQLNLTNKQLISEREQLSILKNERITPFKTIIYSNKLESYYNISKAISSLEYYSITNGFELYNSSSTKKIDIYQLSAREKEFMLNLVSRINESNEIISQNRIFWPRKIREKIDREVGRVAFSSSCLNLVIFNKKGKVRLSCDSYFENLSKIKQLKEKNSDIKEHDDEFLDVLEEMKNELRINGINIVE